MRKLLIALLVVLALLTVVDRVAVRVADRVLADQLADELVAGPRSTSAASPSSRSCWAAGTATCGWRPTPSSARG